MQSEWSTALSVVLHVNTALVYSIHSPFYLIRFKKRIPEPDNPRWMRCVNPTVLPQCCICTCELSIHTNKVSDITNAELFPLTFKLKNQI